MARLRVSTLGRNEVVSDFTRVFYTNTRNTVSLGRKTVLEILAGNLYIPRRSFSFLFFSFFLERRGSPLWKK